jgi:hypothetical protein
MRPSRSSDPAVLGKSLGTAVFSDCEFEASIELIPLIQSPAGLAAALHWIVPPPM